ncbi:hypothetical protein RBG61_05035 [Paludicola sp. MB14-C6]|uniref:hypothetical protein n=1 Tax=Paludihabitans sp. MB14-C6 TaxID=3070656 RepID=UPI0027DE8C2F|nr:hypothetical protein [Paludicola sp. MB14-C6]WMJ24037.1 hypothetical protein RBG61_05035 [Paludicola sp. MB14-C6]
MGIVSYALGGVFVLLGIIMAIKPAQSTKEEERECKKAIRRTRINGIAIACAGVLFIVLVSFI